MSMSEEVATRFGVSADVVRQQFAKNARSLREGEETARKMYPKKYRGFTVAEWTANAERYERMAAGDE